MNLLKSFKSYLLLGIKLFDIVLINFWNVWINVLKELLENPQVTKSNQSQLIEVKSVQSFRGEFRTYLKIYRTF